ncbi:uncharacterized protein LOC110252595 [Exaiptasia diaphana]|uniref:Uncharacterized protein n=1 Tax=Exaiptasia diaphana TaxID=2652724 RepID=A0A913Y4Q2_EXADI|nr:uncharacterized protein LOC110252595 [Exaiptasia diaphana]
MSSSKLSKITRQHERTWSQLHKRLIDLDFNFSGVFKENVWEYLSNTATSTSTSIGYLIPCILASTAFIASKKGSLIHHKNHDMPFNLYILFVGPPSTGKSQALKQAATLPMSTIIDNYDITNFLLDKCTSSGLAKTVAENKEGYIVSPEIFDLLNKLLKSDDENATGDAQLLCELFSGERVTYRFATERVREIDANVPFSMVGATQVPFAARLIARLDQGHGLLDRFMMMFPPCYRPTVEETDRAIQWLNEQNIESLTDIFLEMAENLRKVNYKFTDDAQALLQQLSTQEIEDINQALKDGDPVPKCKKCDLVKRIAGCLHIFNNIATNLLDGQKPPTTPQRITKSSVEAAITILNYCNTQKQIATEFINNIVSECVENEARQPSKDVFKAALLNFPGPIVLCRSFKQYGPRALRSISDHEFKNIASQMNAYGKIVTVRVPRSTRPTLVFVKKEPQAIDWDVANQICDRETYLTKFTLPIHNSVSQGIKTQLTAEGHINVEL